MNVKNLVQWSEIIGAISIVISLFYVGYQVKLNTKAIEVETLNNIAAGPGDLFEVDHETAKLLVKVQE